MPSHVQLIPISIPATRPSTMVDANGPRGRPARAPPAPSAREGFPAIRRPVPGMSAYCGSKFALEGVLEALGKEVAQFGVHVTAIEPGSFRTDWAGRSMTRVDHTIDDYDELFVPIRAARQKASGNQLGNPAKAGEAVVHIAAVEHPPAHLPLGSDALRLVRAARSAVDADIRAWEQLSRTTDFADGAQL